MNVLRARRDRRRHARALAALPDFVDLTIVAIRAGHSPATAIVDARRYAPRELGDALDETLQLLERGTRLADALAAFGRRLGGDAATLADTLGTADRYGLALEPVLDRLAIDSREARRRHAERYARTLPVRLSFPLVMCTLPGFVLSAIAPALLGALSTLRDLAP